MMFKLALNLGMTVGELGKRMTAEELIEWMAYDRVFPLPNQWRQTAEICQTVAQAFLKKRNRMPWKPEDFMPIHRLQRELQSEEETLARLDAIAASFGG